MHRLDCFLSWNWPIRLNGSERSVRISRFDTVPRLLHTLDWKGQVCTSNGLAPSSCMAYNILVALVSQQVRCALHLEVLLFYTYEIKV